MLFGSLTESEVKKISALLESEGISFKVVKDAAVLEQNDRSRRYDLRHLFPPNLSTSVLAIEVEDGSFSRMSKDLVSKLLDYGITNEVPAEFEGQEFGEVNHLDLAPKRGRQTGVYGLLSMALALGIALLYFFKGR